MQAISRIRSKTVVIPSEDIDTDQIIPARFLTTTTKTGLGKNLFSDWRYQADGSERAEFVLNTPAASGAQVLVGGNNFGCGSSREHAPWALLDYGFRAVISTEIADIFRSNSLKNGLIPVIVTKDVHQWLVDNPGAEVSIDLETSTLTLPDGQSIGFPIDSFARYCLLNGIDQLGFLMQHSQTILDFEQRAS
jgi:3-isopropylmalate/(R)-2-methylmalate dehydratase small subunit